MLSKLGTCSLIYSEMPLQNAFQCMIGSQQIIVNPNGWNIDIRNILLAKKRAYRRYKSTHSQADKLEYTRIRRETKRLIKISKKLHELHIASNCKVNPKEFFRYVREKKTLKSTIGPLLSAEGEIVTDERETADILNEYFASVFTVEEDRGEEAVPFQNDSSCTTVSC